MPLHGAWDEKSGIYHDAWSQFIGLYRAELVTESGANLFDQFGEVREKVAAFLAGNPGASYGAVAGACGLDQLESRISMNKKSPRVLLMWGAYSPREISEGGGYMI